MDSLPLVLINHGTRFDLAEKFPGRIGVLRGPSRSCPNEHLPVGLDNDRFAVWSKCKEWDEVAFLKMIEEAQEGQGIMWVVVPDVVGDAVETFREWSKWAPRLRAMGLPLALAVQDGMTPSSVRLCADPDVIFVGGTTEWKRRTLWNWCLEFPRVHCGRVNTEKWLWNAHRCGAESTDGTGWFRGGPQRTRGLIRYLERSTKGLTPFQKELAFADTFLDNDDQPEGHY